MPTITPLLALAVTILGACSPSYVFTASPPRRPPADSQNVKTVLIRNDIPFDIQTLMMRGMTNVVVVSTESCSPCKILKKQLYERAPYYPDVSFTVIEFPFDLEDGVFADDLMRVTGPYVPFVIIQDRNGLPHKSLSLGARTETTWAAIEAELNQTRLEPIAVPEAPSAGPAGTTRPDSSRRLIEIRRHAEAVLEGLEDIEDSCGNEDRQFSE